MLETVAFVFKRVVVFKTVVLFEVILGREDDATDPMGNERREKCIFCIVLSHVSIQRLFRDDRGLSVFTTRGSLSRRNDGRVARVKRVCGLRDAISPQKKDGFP